MISILHLGDQCLTGVFPKTRDEKVEKGPLELIKCGENEKGGTCGLVQLRQSYDPDQMYGDNYGYRSGLNASMVKHLNSRVGNIMKIASIVPRDIVIDIGSNDSTLLNAYPKNGVILAGFDPTGGKFKKILPQTY